MSNYLIPIDDDLIEAAAKAICRSRMRQDADRELIALYGRGLDELEPLELAFDKIFQMLWEGKSQYDEDQRKMYRDDARAAISAINLKLLIAE